MNYLTIITLCHSERNIVIKAVKTTAGGLLRLLLRRLLRLLLWCLLLLLGLVLLLLLRLTLWLVAAKVLSTAVVLVALVVVATTAATAVEHLHFVGDDFGGVAVLAVLALPFAGAQRAFDVDFRAFAQILAGNFCQAVKEHHSVPFGTLLWLTGCFVFPLLGGSHADVGYRASRWHVFCVWVLP